MSCKDRTRQGKVKRVVLGGRRAEYMGKGEMEGRNWGIGDPRWELPCLLSLDEQRAPRA